MNHKVLERVISSYMSLDLPSYSFCWQGGEPLLMGMDFLKSWLVLMMACFIAYPG